MVSWWDCALVFLYGIVLYIRVVIWYLGGIVHWVRKVFSRAISSRAVNQSTDHWLYNAIRWCAVIFNTIQCYTMLYNAVQWYALLYYYTMLQDDIHWYTIHWYTIHWYTMQCYSTDHWLNHRWVIPRMPQFTQSPGLTLHWREVTQVQPVKLRFIIFSTSKDTHEDPNGSLYLRNPIKQPVQVHFIIWGPVTHEETNGKHESVTHWVTF